MKGRKPTTPEARRARGEIRAGRDVPLVVAGRELPRMPAGLTEGMKTIWRAVVRDLDGAGVLDRADWAIVEAFVIAVARAREARALLALSPTGLLTTNSQGVVAHPALAIEERAWKEVRQLAEALPLSPWGRARLNLHGTAPGGAGFDDVLGPARLTAVK